MKNTQDLITQAHAINQQQLNIPSQDVLMAQTKKYEKLRTKKERAEQTAIKQLKSFLAKPVFPDKPLNRPQYIAARTLGYISHPVVDPIFSISLAVSSCLLVDSVLGGVGVCLMTSASLCILSKKLLPRLMTRTQAVNEIIPLLENLSTSDNPNVQKHVEQLAQKLNDPNIPATFWSKCYDILIDADTAVHMFKEQTKAVESLVAIEVEEKADATILSKDFKRMKL